MLTIIESLKRLGFSLPDNGVQLEALTGGVSSNIWRCDIGGASYCIKQALEKLKVEQEWYASLERNVYEWKWLNFVSAHKPCLVPELIGRDEIANVIVMAYLPADEYINWKSQLMLGQADAETASNIGKWLSRIHGLSTDSINLEAEFPANTLFDELRVDPYIRSLIPVYPQITTQLNGIIDMLLTSRTALIHGDISPKNILIKNKQPTFLDAECACFGDPAFDIAFCLNHLLLKSIFRPEYIENYMICFKALANTYFDNISWESKTDLDVRTSKYLPALMLARIDGKSPVEYLTDETDKSHVREFAINTLINPIPSIIDFADAWVNNRKIT